MQPGLITQNNAPLVQVLQTQAKAYSLRDLAGLDAKDVGELISSSPEALAAIPQQHEGETNEQKSARTAQDLRGLANAVYPTASLAARLHKQSSSGNPVISADTARLLANLPELELRDAHVDRFLKQQSDDAFAGVADRAAAVAQLKTMQRVLRIAPVAEHAEILLRDGLHSARDIASLSALAFAETYAVQLGGAAHAKLYYNKALETTASSALLSTTIHQATHDVSPVVVPQSSPIRRCCPT